MKPVAVLGVGPAGLMAAHAVALAGRPVALFSQGDSEGKIKRSNLGGAQFLHDPIPGINDEDPDVEITYGVEGDADTYKRKVYGSNNVPFVSFTHVHNGKEQPAWNLRDTYDTMWDALNIDDVGNVQDITTEWIDRVIEEAWFDHIFSTVPLQSICKTLSPATTVPAAPHLFTGHDIRIANEAMRNSSVGNKIWYDGTMDHSWYRTSSLFGHESTEWGASCPAPPLQTFTVRKPIATNCDCYDNQVVRLGRYGTWKKGVLTHHAFVEAAKVVM